MAFEAPDRKQVFLAGTPKRKLFISEPDDFENRTLTIPTDKDYDTINTTGLTHSCGNLQVEMHVHVRSKANPDLYNYSHTVNPRNKCEGCEKIRLQREEDARIRKEAEDFKNSIEVIDSFNDGGGSYDWSEAEIGKSPDGRLWYRYGAGCSCNSISDEDWSPFTEIGQIREAVRHITARPHERANFIADAQGLLSERQA